jgi:hypothetical protein
MKNYFLSLAMLLTAITAFPQSKILISKPDVSYSNNILTVKYDITGCGTNQFIDISLKVINSKGDMIRPSYISGDIGSGVNCGMGKTILWNVVKDSIKIDDDVEVMLSGNEINPSVPNIIIPVAPGLTIRILRTIALYHIITLLYSCTSICMSLSYPMGLLSKNRPAP